MARTVMQAARSLAVSLSGLREALGTRSMDEAPIMSVDGRDLALVLEALLQVTEALAGPLGSFPKGFEEFRAYMGREASQEPRDASQGCTCGRAYGTGNVAHTPCDYCRYGTKGGR